MKKNNKNALILFVKAPRLGTVKTRLQPDLTKQQSLKLYRAMVEELVRQFREVHFCDLKIYFYPANALREMKSWLGGHFEYFPQQGGDLGEKMQRAIAEMLAQRYQKVVLVGSDIPTLDRATVADAFIHLNEKDLVVGPCPDGGYYLVGMKTLHRTLFQEIPWSSARVLKQTLQKAKQARLNFQLLAYKSDIDTFSALVALWADLQKKNRPDEIHYKIKIYKVLQEIFQANVISKQD